MVRNRGKYSIKMNENRVARLCREKEAERDKDIKKKIEKTL